MAKDSKKQETPQVTPTMQKIMDHDEKMKIPQVTLLRVSSRKF